MKSFLINNIKIGTVIKKYANGITFVEKAYLWLVSFISLTIIRTVTSGTATVTYVTGTEATY